jgi:hypothetical protein
MCKSIVVVIECLSVYTFICGICPKMYNLVKGFVYFYVVVVLDVAS